MKRVYITPASKEIKIMASTIMAGSVTVNNEPGNGKFGSKKKNTGDVWDFEEEEE